MHVLGHSFSQKRKCTKRPRDLQIRKVSFSGSSLSDGSLSSSTASSACTAPMPATPSSYQHYNQLPLPQQYHAVLPAEQHHTAPLRLHERAYKSRSRCAGARSDSFFYDDTAVTSDDEEDMYCYDKETEDDVVEVEGTQFFMELPPSPTMTNMSTDNDDTPKQQRVDSRPVSTDYFYLQHLKRPQLLSRWSESTIQTLEQYDDVPTPCPEETTAHPCDEYEVSSDEEEDEDVDFDEEDETPVEIHQARPVRINFSHKYQRTVSAPEARPPMRVMDSVDDFIKRGGWKRRGIVFDGREVALRDSDCFTVI